MNSKFLILINLLFLSSYVYSTEENKKFLSETLCFNEEKINFYCVLENKKTVSVCSGTSKGTLYSKYRYGTQGNIEFEFPNNIKDESQKIYYVNLAGGSVTMDDNLIFDYDDQRYNVWSAGSLRGVFILEKKDGVSKDAFSSECDDSKISDDFYKRNTVYYEWEKYFPNDSGLYLKWYD